jgi:hypothetical protein
VTFDDNKATVQDKKTGETAFICKKGSNGIFYLTGVREGDHKDTTEQELLLIIKCLKISRNILLGHKIQVFTEYKSLTFKSI